MRRTFSVLGLSLLKIADWRSFLAHDAFVERIARYCHDVRPSVCICLSGMRVHCQTISCIVVPKSSLARSEFVSFLFWKHWKQKNADAIAHAFDQRIIVNRAHQPQAWYSQYAMLYCCRVRQQRLLSAVGYPVTSGGD